MPRPATTRAKAAAEAEHKAAAAIRAGRRELLKLALDGREVTADEYTARIHTPDGVSQRALGAVPGALRRAGLIEEIGFRRSTRPERRGTTNSVWRLKPGAEHAARRWLAEHPPIPEPSTPPAGTQLSLI